MENLFLEIAGFESESGLIMGDFSRSGRIGLGPVQVLF